MSEMYVRELTLEHRDLSDTDRTVPAVLATEAPVARADGIEEILDLSDPAKVEFRQNPLPLIEQHNHSRLNIGVVENLRVVGRKLRGTVRFGTSRRAQEVFEDVKAGIVRSLSIGYQWLDWVRSGDIVRVTNFRVFETSLVSLPADPNSGFYRGLPTMSDDTHTPEASEASPKLSRSARRANAAAVQEERERVRSIQSKIDWMRQEYSKTNPAFVARAEEYSNGLIEDGADVSVMLDWIRDNRPRPEAIQFRGFGGSPWEQAEVANSYSTNSLPRITREHVRSAFGDNHKEASQRAYIAGQWIRGALLGKQDAQRWLRDYTPYLNRFIGGSHSGGGSLIPEELSSAIINLRNEYGVARQYCSVFNMSSDSLLVPKKLSGVSSYYVGEGNEITKSTPTLTNVGLFARKLAILTRFSSELAEDSVIDLASFLADEAGFSFAKAEDDALFNGDGTSTYGGIVGLPGKITTASASAVSAAAGHNLLSEIDVDDLAALTSKLPIYARRNARWFCSQQAYDLIFMSLLVASGGTSMVEQGTYRPTQFWGHEIVVTPSISQTPTTDLTNLPILFFGDLNLCSILGSRRDLDSVLDQSRYLENDLLAFRAIERYDLVVHSVDDPTTVGPMVMLYGGT